MKKEIPIEWIEKLIEMASIVDKTRGSEREANVYTLLGYILATKKFLSY